MDPGRTRPPVLNGLNGSPGSTGRSRGGRPGLLTRTARGVGHVRARRAGHVRARPGLRRLVRPDGLTLRDWVSGLGCARRRPRISAYHRHAVPARPAAWAPGAADDRRAAGRRLIVPLAFTTALARRRAGGRCRDGRRRAASGRATVPRAEWSQGRANGAWTSTGTGDVDRGRDRRREPWPRAARLGPADAAIARASRECFARRRGPPLTDGGPRGHHHGRRRLIERYVSKGRCPADDLLEETR